VNATRMDPASTLIADAEVASANAAAPAASTSAVQVQSVLTTEGPGTATALADQVDATGAGEVAAAALQDVPMSESEPSADDADESPYAPGQSDPLADVEMQADAESGADGDEYKSTGDAAEEESDESDGVVAPGHASRSSAANASSSRGGRKGKGRLDLPDDIDADLYGLRRSVLSLSLIHVAGYVALTLTAIAIFAGTRVDFSGAGEFRHVTAGPVRGVDGSSMPENLLRRRRRLGFFVLLQATSHRQSQEPRE
jgi:hypothetical protein